MSRGVGRIAGDTHAPQSKSLQSVDTGNIFRVEGRRSFILTRVLNQRGDKGRLKERGDAVGGTVFTTINPENL